MADEKEDKKAKRQAAKEAKRARKKEKKEENICKIITESKEQQAYISLKDLENQIRELNITELYRCHQSFIVNLKYVQRYEGSEFVLENGSTIPISRGKKSEAKKRFYDMLREKVRT